MSATIAATRGEPKGAAVLSEPLVQAIAIDVEREGLDQLRGAARRHVHCK
jgi:hypothetical protein